jgi:hypothetical protein
VELVFALGPGQCRRVPLFHLSLGLPGLCGAGDPQP